MEEERLRQENERLKQQLKDYEGFKKRVVPLMKRIAKALERQSN